MENAKSTLSIVLDNIIKDLEELDKLIEKAELQNEQFILDFYDKLNALSVRK